MIYLLTCIVALLAFIVKQQANDRKAILLAARYDKVIEKMKAHGWRE